MDKVKLYAVTKRWEPGEADLAAINEQSMVPLTMEEVFVFRLAAADSQVDRDNEFFAPETLEQMAALYVGKPVLRDHAWSADNQMARIYAAHVEQMEQRHQLILSCYMLRSEATAETIRAIEAGILRECSVGVAVEQAVCNICGESYSMCPHRKGNFYEGKICAAELRGAVDAYEVSFVAVPAQREAGTVKSADAGAPVPDKEAAALQLRLRLLQL